MKVKNIAECSRWSILQYFWPALSDNRSWKPFFCLFESGHFTQVLLYLMTMDMGQMPKFHKLAEVVLKTLYTVFIQHSIMNMTHPCISSTAEIVSFIK